MSKLFIYLRVSTDDKGQDPENQLADCMRYAYEHKWIESDEDAQVWREQAGAWGKTTRPVFDEMMTQTWKQKIPILLVWDYDRLYRDRKKLLETIRNYGLVGTKILSVRQSWLQKILEIPDPFNEMFYELMLHMVAWMAEEESQKKSDRVKIAYKRRKAGAEREGRKVKWGRKTVLTPELIQTVYAHKQSAPELSIRKLAERITLSTGRKVSRTAVQRILSQKGLPESDPQKVGDS